MFSICQGNTRTIRPDLARARMQRREVNIEEVHRASAIPDPFLVMALHDDIRKRKLELELMEYELASMERCTAKGTANVFQSDLALFLCMGRPLCTMRRPTPGKDPRYEGPEVPQGSDFLSWPHDPTDG